MGRVAVQADARQGEFDLGELVKPKPRSYGDDELLAASQLQRLLNCECPRHIVDLVQALVQFEQYSTECSVENWQDAAVHSSIYAYTNQARYLMEKALKAVIDERGSEFQSILNQRDLS